MSRQKKHQDEPDDFHPEDQTQEDCFDEDPDDRELDRAKLYLSRSAPGSRLSEEQEIALAKRIAQGDNDAAGELAKANVGLVISIAEKDFKNCGVSLDDLIGEGYLALVELARRFRHTKNARFSSFASQTIWYRMVDLLNREGVIRKSDYAYRQIKKLKNVYSQFWQEPTIEELAEATGINPDRVRTLLPVSKTVLSLDQPIDGEDGACLGNVIHDQSAANPEDETIRRELRQAFRDLCVEAFDKLHEDQRTVLEMYFGFSGKEYSLVEIAETLGIPPKRVREIKNVALRVLHEPKLHEQFKALK